jgi:hypothetical protein
MARTPTARTSKIVNMGMTGGFYKVEEDFVLDGIPVKKGEKLFVTNMEEIATKPKYMAAMDKNELTKYKAAMEAQLKHDELSLERVRQLVVNQKKYIKLLDEQIKLLGNGIESNV